MTVSFSYSFSYPFSISYSYFFFLHSLWFLGEFFGDLRGIGVFSSEPVFFYLLTSIFYLLSSYSAPAPAYRYNMI